MMGTTMNRKRNTELHDNLSPVEIVEILESLIFTASHGWQRTVSVDRNVRDLIVRGLRAALSAPVTN